MRRKSRLGIEEHVTHELHAAMVNFGRLRLVTVVGCITTISLWTAGRKQILIIQHQYR